MARFDGQTAIITGAGGEIGFATASLLGSEGASITVADFHQERGETTVTLLNEVNVDAQLVVGDVSDPETADAAVRATLETWGRIDILVNNASSFYPTPLEAQHLRSMPLVAGSALSADGTAHRAYRPPGLRRPLAGSTVG